ncbi:hypothetical protein ACW9KT_19930 [Hymenobacter sp. HD11105]
MSLAEARTLLLSWPGVGPKTISSGLLLSGPPKRLIRTACALPDDGGPGGGDELRVRCAPSCGRARRSTSKRRARPARARKLILEDAVASGLSENVELGIQVLVPGGDAGEAAVMIQRLAGLVHKDNRLFLFNPTFRSQVTAVFLARGRVGGRGPKPLPFGTASYT